MDEKPQVFQTLVGVLNGGNLNLSNGYRLLPMTTLKTKTKLETVKQSDWLISIASLSFRPCEKVCAWKLIYPGGERRQERKWLTRRDKEEKDTWQSFLNNRGNNRKEGERQNRATLLKLSETQPLTWIGMIHFNQAYSALSHTAKKVKKLIVVWTFQSFASNCGKHSRQSLSLLSE